MATNRFAELIRMAQKGKPKAKAAKRVPSGPSKLEVELWGQLQVAGLTEGMETEYHAIPGRRYRWDIAWPAQRLLVEIQGGIWSKGGHSTGVGITRDVEKANMAVWAGWRILAVTGNHIKSGQALLWIQQALAVK
jgi:very-short-patch-repair endonuclease